MGRAVELRARGVLEVYDPGESTASVPLPTCAHCRAEVPPPVRVCPSCHALVPQGPPPIVPGATIDLTTSRIVVDARLGEGGMGVVWRAWRFYPPGDPRSQSGPEPLALKVLRPSVGGTEQLRRYFTREAELLARVSHPNVVRAYEMFDHGGAAVLALELVDGDPLDAIIARHVARARLAGPGALPGMPFLRSWAYFEQLLGALATMHALGVVHRDVKPQNVLVRRDGIVKLGDFGIAKHVRNDPNAPPDLAGTDAGAAPGTGAYMSPEQVLSRPLDGRSDLYSAAIVLYEMLSGRTPFTTAGKSELLVRQEQVTGAPPPLRAFVPQAPPALDALFTRALAKDAAQRFQDAIAMGNAFRGAFGLAETAEWRAQIEMAQRAAAPAAADTAKRMGTLRDFLVERYQTAPMPARPAR